jgi:exopolysaccharide biosynthesis polyprenyl glycosylphosphotransferase
MDFLATVAGLFAAAFLDLALHTNAQVHVSMRESEAAGALVGLFVVLLLKSENAYREAGSLLQIRETERAIRTPALALLALLPFNFLLHLHFSGATILASFLLIPLFLIFEKQLFASLIRSLHVKGHGGRRVVVYGAGNTARRIVSALLYSPRFGMQPVAAIDDNPELPVDWIFELGYRHRSSIPVRQGPATPMLLKSCDCEILLIAIPSLCPEKLAAATRAAKQAGMQVAYLANSRAQEWQWTESVDIDGLLVTSSVDPVMHWHYAIAKRAVDLVLSALLLALLSPLLIVVVLLIQLDSPGPALFVQKRVGLNGRLFDIYKFRSMHIDVPKYDVSPATSYDRRITRIGRLLRRTSLDELPQLVNVLKGQMSLVGPRPEMPFIAELHDSRHRQRLQVVPGITGLWQLSADRVFQIHENIEYDLYYIRNRTFLMDIAILVHTLFFAMHGV